MIDNDNFLVSRAVAERAGVIGQKWKTDDGRYILDRKTLSRIRLTSEEYITGLQGVERVTKEEAITLAAKAGWKMGDDEPSEVNEKPSEINEKPSEEKDPTVKTTKKKGAKS